MSILPAYLCSFSSVAPLQRGLGERLGVDRISQKDEETKRSRDALVVRSGDVVSSYGDVFSPSSSGKQEEKSTQDLKSNEKVTQELTDGEKQQVSELKQRDAEVKAHEAAHLAAAGGLAQGGASYEYQKGPDGQNYAVGGEVSIDSSAVDGNPEATITKAQQIRSAALAPASPSSQDYKVAAQASRIEAEARQELAKKSQGTQESNGTAESQSTDENENVTDQRTSQYASNRAVMKYTANSQGLASRVQAGFRGFA